MTKESIELKEHIKFLNNKITSLKGFIKHLVDKKDDRLTNPKGDMLNVLDLLKGKEYVWKLIEINDIVNKLE